jgi:ParB-like nuclease domain
MQQIEKTKDYARFNLLKGNRPINRAHLKKLKESIAQSNHLNLHPIIVNQNFEIIDGQHRLQCAKELDVEIFFVKSDSVEDQHLISCNVNQKSFECENYIDYFAIKEQNPEYIRLKKMLEASGLKPKALLTLIIGIVSGNLLEFLKTGKFKFPSKEGLNEVLEFYMDFIAYAHDKRLKPTSMFTNHNFTRAIRWIYNTTGFDRVVFFKKLDLRWFDLKPQRTAEDWYTLIISIYNFKNHNRLENEYVNGSEV